ncbi:uncharacterized protein LOC143199059 [Rhynchophorus ferrugineus]|uniref:uncharacterized protein LOC143199059 n=1 Tax=Rhynchophorus ferrugineus TaxID=354439 RepID=UPI003FCD968D
MAVAVLLVTLALSATISSQEVFENSTHICQKCTCIDEARFTLDCQNQTFHNTIAEWPKHNVPLLATFSYNNIVHLEILPQSDKVIDLVFSHCNIKSMDNGVFKAVRNVQFVDLSFNALTTEEIGPEKFKGPYNDTQYEPLNVNHLDISYNQIHSLPHNIFEHLKNLRQLNLEGNHFKVLDIPTQTALSSVIYLESLNLANNELTELVGDAIKDLKHLKDINLAYNKLNEVPETLSYVGNTLEFLNLNSNPIFELTDESFLGVQSIIELTLTNLSRLTYVHANTFSPIERLKILHLHSNINLFSINSEAFGARQGLKEMYLQDNALSTLSYNLTNWLTLDLLNLSGNQFYCTCDIYKIRHDLNQIITRDKDGPVCVDYITGNSKMLYELEEKDCEEEEYEFSYDPIIEKHYFLKKLLLTFIVCVLLICLVVLITVFLLRLRRYRMNRNYNFATQVWYSQITNSTP